MHHLPRSLPLIVMTSHINPSTCPLLYSRTSDLSILLPTPIPYSEVQSFGFAAPTTSTTVTLALADALAISVVRRLHPDPAAVFKVYHPGGAIGLDNKIVGLPSPEDMSPSDPLARPPL